MPVYNAEKRDINFEFKCVTSFEDETVKTDTSLLLGFMWVIDHSCPCLFQVSFLFLLL